MDTNIDAIIVPFQNAAAGSESDIEGEGGEAEVGEESSTGKADFENKIASDRGKRFDYLLKQTEIFSHFMSSTGTKSPEKPKGRPKKKEPTAEEAAE